MRNEKLIEAREQRCWTQADVAEMIGVSRVTYARWEEQGVIPHPYAINKAREVFKMTPEQLGFRKYPSSPVTTSLKQAPSGQVSEITSAGEKVDMFTIAASALALARQIYGCTLAELLCRIEQEMRRLDNMAQEHEGKKTPRRQVLIFLASLPIALLGLTKGENASISPIDVEEILPLYITSIPACWQLYFVGMIAEVKRTLPHQLIQLSLLAQEPSRQQKVISSMTSQAYQLDSLLALQSQDFGAALASAKQAFKYGELAEDPNLQTMSLMRQADVYFYLRRRIQTLKITQEAMQYSKSISPLLQGYLYSSLAEAQANVKKESATQEAEDLLKLAHDTFPDHPESDPNFAYTHFKRITLANNTGLTYLNLRKPKLADKVFSQVEKLIPTTLTPQRVQLLNRQAAIAVALGDMDQSCSKIEVAATAALTLEAELRYGEACEIYQQMQEKWPHERRVQTLADLFIPAIEQQY